jgi:hypothetical protein
VANPYSTGSGGTHLEARIVASALAGILCEAPKVLRPKAALVIEVAGAPKTTILNDCSAASIEAL